MHLQVDKLLKLPCEPKQNPTIEGAGISIEYEANKDRHFEDRQAFMAGNEKYMEDVTRQANVVSNRLIYAHLYV